MVKLKRVDTKIRVRYKETDKMGVVHHSNYYVWFEVARTEYMRANGLSYDEMEKRGFMLPLTETHCKYIHGAVYDDQVLVQTTMSKFSGARIVMEYKVIHEEKEYLIAEGQTIHAITNEDLKPINIKKADMELYKLFQKCVES